LEEEQHYWDFLDEKNQHKSDTNVSKEESSIGHKTDPDISLQRCAIRRIV
jgi:hypothetical protein